MKYEHEQKLLDFPLSSFQQITYSVLVGWWLGLVWLILGYIFCLTLFLLPLGIFMLINTPFLLMLRSPRLRFEFRMGGEVSPQTFRVFFGTPDQLPLLVRVPISCWLAGGSVRFVL